TDPGALQSRHRATKKIPFLGVFCGCPAFGRAMVSREIPDISTIQIQKVRSLHGKGKGIPQSLRAFARVLSAKSLEELKEMCSEASENDGRLARRPLRSRSREIEAHCILISHIKSAIQEYNASIELLESRDTLSNATLQPRRRQMARDLLSGELRVLKSACSWLTNYCSC
ncbi:hypothetical protein Taro_046650, partial [Colocasia esculenta]|nr:hypothetical protein [Colocasia esculenta]